MRRQIKRPRVLLTMRQEKRPPVSRKKRKKPFRTIALKMVGKGGFEPPKSATTDLQSAPFGLSGISPLWSW